MKPGRAAAVLALLLAAFAYFPRLGAPLMWDDRPFLINVPELARPIPLSAYVSPSYFERTGELTWRPLATLSYNLGVRAFGLSPVPLRATSLVLHLANCVLLALLTAGAGLGAAVGLGAAALFLVHPANSETLMTVTFNKELLATLGVLAMLLFHQRRRRGLAAAALAFAVLPKETGILGLLFAPLYDAVTAGRAELVRRWKDHAAYAAVAAIYLLIRFGPMKGPGGEANLSANLPWTERLFYAAHAFASSARIALVPWRLRIQYFALPATSPLVYACWLAAAAALVASALALAWRARQDRPALAFFLLWPLPALFLTSNLIPTAVLSTRLLAERWLYMPLASFAVVVAYALRNRPKTMTVLLLFWGGLLFARLQDWSSEPRLWQSLVDVYPWSANAHEGLGEALFRAGHTPEAEASFRRGLALREDREDLVLRHYVPFAPPGTLSWESASLYRELGLCRLRLDDDREGANFMTKAAALQPSDVFSRRVLAYLDAKHGDFKAATSRLDEGLRIDPQDSFLLRLKPDIEKRKLTFRANFD